MYYVYILLSSNISIGTAVLTPVVYQVTERMGRPAHYKLTTTVMTWMKQGAVEEEGQEGMGQQGVESDECMNLGGSIMRQKEDDLHTDHGSVLFFLYVTRTALITLKKHYSPFYYSSSKFKDHFW